MPKGQTDRPRRTSPVAMPGKPAFQLNVYIGADTVARIDELADAEERSRSQVTRRLIERGMSLEAAA